MIDKEENSGALRRETATIPRPILMSPVNSPPTTPIAERVSMAQSMSTAQIGRTYSPMGRQSPKSLYGPAGSHGPMGLQSPASDRYGSAKLYAQYLREEKNGPDQVRIDSPWGNESLHEDDVSESGFLDF